MPASRRGRPGLPLVCGAGPRGAPRRVRRTPGRPRSAHDDDRPAHVVSDSPHIRVRRVRVPFTRPRVPPRIASKEASMAVKLRTTHGIPHTEFPIPSAAWKASSSRLDAGRCGSARESRLCHHNLVRALYGPAACSLPPPPPKRYSEPPLALRPPSTEPGTSPARGAPQSSLGPPAGPVSHLPTPGWPRRGAAPPL